MAQTKTKSSSKPKRKSSNSGKSSSNKEASKPAASKPVEKATKAVGNAADKAKMPLVAGGAALAGMAGGAVLGARRAHRHSRMDKAIKLAHELRQARQPPNGSKQHRSPVEVVLQGLTSRR